VVVIVSLVVDEAGLVDFVVELIEVVVGVVVIVVVLVVVEFGSVVV
jgi:hypothetical protein